MTILRSDNSVQVECWVQGVASQDEALFLVENPDVNPTAAVSAVRALAFSIGIDNYQRRVFPRTYDVTVNLAMSISNGNHPVCQYLPDDIRDLLNANMSTLIVQSALI